MTYIKMTPEEKQANATAIIVKFMGLKTFKHYSQTLFRPIQPEDWKIDIGLLDMVATNFDTSWDWLLPVYKKVSSALYLLADKVNTPKKFRKIDDKQKFLNRIEAIDCAIKCEILGVRIKEAHDGIVEAIVFYELYKNIK
jgi:hypothetical protein